MGPHKPQEKQEGKEHDIRKVDNNHIPERLYYKWSQYRFFNSKEFFFKDSIYLWETERGAGRDTGRGRSILSWGAVLSLVWILDLNLSGTDRDWKVAKWRVRGFSNSSEKWELELEPLEWGWGRRNGFKVFKKQLIRGIKVISGRIKDDFQMYSVVD